MSDYKLETRNKKPDAFAERVHEADAGAARVLTLPTPVDRVVSFRGSFETLPDFGAAEELEQKLVTMMLDKGTLRRDRFAVAEALENRGVQLHFNAGGVRCGFSGRALRDDLPDVLALLAEQLREPLFDAGEFEKVKAQHAASLRRSLDNTGSQASGALARRLYPADHPNFQPDVGAMLDRLEALSVEDVRAYHAAHLGGRGLLVAFAGACDPEATARLTADTLGDWPVPTAAASFAAAADAGPPGRVEVEIADRQNLDVRFGHPVALRRDSDDFLALHLGNYVLGGNFSARLMSTVRDEQGLTYGIGSALSGVRVEYEGYWRIAVTLSGDALERGIEATREQARLFVEGGITQAELEEKKQTLTGAYKVGLATTGGLAGALLTNAERGFGVAYLDDFPRHVGALTVEQVNTAIARHLDAERLHLAVAGTLPAQHAG
ncbi:MAG: pitrilysin family protein [Bacteroidota bacterium]